MIARNTGNEIKIYDRWHDPLPNGTSPYTHFEDYLYTDYYDNTSSYPEKYDLNNKILSTHYKVEFTIDKNPYDDGYILPKSLADDLYSK